MTVMCRPLVTGLERVKYFLYVLSTNFCFIDKTYLASIHNVLLDNGNGRQCEYNHDLFEFCLSAMGFTHFIGLVAFYFP